MKIPITLEIDMNMLSESVFDEVRVQQIRQIVAQEVATLLPSITHQITQDVIHKIIKEARSRKKRTKQHKSCVTSALQGNKKPPVVCFPTGGHIQA